MNVQKFCGKTYGKRTILDHHLKVAHEIGEMFPCHDCEKIFPSKHTLKKHFANIHEGVKNVECKQYGK